MKINIKRLFPSLAGNNVQPLYVKKKQPAWNSKDSKFKIQRLLTVKNDSSCHGVLTDNGDKTEDAIFNYFLPEIDCQRKTYYPYLKILPDDLKKNDSFLRLLTKCLASQVGLAAIIILWMILATVLLYFFEGSVEVEAKLNISSYIRKVQIELATELRQINVQSQSWLKAIEKTLKQCYDVTATSAYERMTSSQVWSKSATFLYVVECVTFFGTGCPTSVTLVGSLITTVTLAIFIPAHVFLVYNCKKAFLNSLRRGKRKENNSIEPCGYFARIILSSDLIWLFLLIIYYILGLVAYGPVLAKDDFDMFTFPKYFTNEINMQKLTDVHRSTYAVYLIGAFWLAVCFISSLVTQLRKAIVDTLKPYDIYVNLLPN